MMKLKLCNVFSVRLIFTFSIILPQTVVLSVGCPPLCGCLGNAISCENLDLKKVKWQNFPHWTESLSLRQIRGFRHLSTSAVQSLTRLDGLKHLNITSCHEKLDLDGDWLKHLPSLEVLKVSHCKLEKTPIFKPPHPNLKSLILNRNNIEKIRVGTFDSLPNLTRLEVNFNNLKELDKRWFRKGHPLNILSANGNSIRQLDPLLNATLTSLRELRLNRNRLCQLLSSWKRDEEKSSPKMSKSNRFGSTLPLTDASPPLSGDTSKLPLKPGRRRKRSVISNDCDGGGSHLPTMPHVHTLELSRNRISLIRTLTFASWKSLKVLRLKRNLLQEGSLDGGAFFIENGGITTLDLTANKKLHRIEKKWLYASSSLRELILAKCGLRYSLPTGLFTDHHTKLRRLDLSGNKLDHLRVYQFAKLKSLEVLNLSGNRLKGFPADVFYGLKSLRKISLSNNAITSLTPQESSFQRSIPSTSALNSLFKPLSNLLELDLSYNRLTRLDRNDFAGLTQLQILNLRRNNLTRFSPPESHCPKLSRLIMDSSHFTCDCSAMSLLRWLHDRLLQDATTTVSANCSRPAKFAGKQLMSLGAEQLGSCGPQTSLEPNVMYRGNTSMWVLRGGNLTLRCEVVIAGIPSSWSNAQRAALRPKVVWEQVDTTTGRRRLLVGRPSLPMKTQYQVVELVAVQNRSNSKKTSARWLSLLRIKPAKKGYEEHLGGFQCKADNSYGHDSSPLVQVEVYELPRFTEKPDSIVSTLAGSVVTIPCSAIGTPQPVPALRKYGVIDFPAARDRRLSIFNGDTCFTIANVQRKDAGKYVCESVNDAGKISFHFTLEVNEIPNFKKWPRPKAVFTVGQSAVVPCMATGYPFPTITWTKNGRPLQLNSAPASSPLLNRSVDETSETKTPRSAVSTIIPPTNHHPKELQLADQGQLLLFLNVVTADAAEYECTLLNAVGRKRAKIVVDVRTAGGRIYSGSQRREEVERQSNGGRLSGHMTGIVVIAVVVCVVATSLAWVAALYCFRWRKRAAAAAAASSAASGCPQTSSMIHPGRRPLLARSVSSNSEIFMTSRAGLGSYSRLQGLGLGPNYHLGMDEEDLIDTAAAARYLLEKHRMLRRDATRAYDGAVSEPSGMGEDIEEEDDDSGGGGEVVENNRRTEGAPTSDYNTGTSSECSAHSLCVSGNANCLMPPTSKVSSPCPGQEHLPVSASSPLISRHSTPQTESCNSPMFAYLTIPQSDRSSRIPAVTSFGVALHETDEYV